jgi:hypothetical protein
MFEINMNSILSDYPNVTEMLRVFNIDMVSFQSIKKNKSGSFNAVKGEKTYKAFLKLEKAGYVTRKPFKKVEVVA